MSGIEGSTVDLYDGPLAAEDKICSARYGMKPLPDLDACKLSTYYKRNLLRHSFY